MIKNKKSLATIAVFMLAMNLRAPIVSLSAVSELISSELGLSSSMIGMLTTLPLLAFSAAPLLIPSLTKCFSLVKAIVVGILLIAVGEIFRSLSSVIGLYAGTLFLGLGIGIENVLVLRFIKAYFQDRIGVMTGFFSSVMSLMSGIGAWLSLELALRCGWNWRQAVSIWIPTILIALVVWIIQVQYGWPQLPGSVQSTAEGLNFKQKLRHLLFYISMQSFVFYCMVAWLPSILQSTGTRGDVVGSMTFSLQLVSVPAGLFFPILAQYLKKKTNLIILTGVFLISGIFILLIGPSLSLQYLSVVLIGIGLGGSFSLGMALINFLATSPEEASSLAAKSFSIGYLVASAGPLSIGFIHDQFVSWAIPLSIILVAVFIMTYHGLRTHGRSKEIVA